MLIFVPIMLCCSAHKIYLLCSKLCSRRIVLSLLSIIYSCYYQYLYANFHNKSTLIVDNVFIRVYKQNALYVLLDNDCSIREYQSFVAIL